MSILLTYPLTNLGIAAPEVDPEKLTRVAIPDESPYGIPVLNKQGYEKVSSNEYIDSFVETAANTRQPVLEIGAAFGQVVHRVLAAGSKITACDLDATHLEIIVRQAKKAALENLYVYPGKFPEEVVFPPSSFSAILASRILHFLEDQRLEVGLSKIYNWLEPEGKFYFTAMSVYHDSIREEFLPIYQANMSKGMKWGGHIEDQMRFAPVHKFYAPSFIHVFDVPQLEKILPEFGFEVEKISLFRYPDDLSSGEQGHIGFVARKSSEVRKIK